MSKYRYSGLTDNQIKCAIFELENIVIDAENIIKTLKQKEVKNKHYTIQKEKSLESISKDIDYMVKNMRDFMNSEFLYPYTSDGIKPLKF